MTENYIGQCDKIRRSGPQGELIWQTIMDAKQKISKEEFLANVDPWVPLDNEETIDEFMQGDPDAYFARSWCFNSWFYFICHSGFEFIWQSDEPHKKSLS